MSRMDRFITEVLAGDPAALEALATLQLLPSALALALLRHLTDETD